MFASRPLRSTVVTRFLANMGRSDSRRDHPTVIYSRRTLADATSPGLPGSSTDLSSRAVSYHPGRFDGCTHPLLPHRCQASPLCGGLATFHCLTGPNQVRLRYGLRVRPSKASPEGLLPLALAGLLVERVIYKVNSFQFTRSTRLVLALPRSAPNAHLGATFAVPGCHSPLFTNHCCSYDFGLRTFYLIDTKSQNRARSAPACQF